MSKQKETKQEICRYPIGLHKCIASEIKESLTPKEKKEKYIPLPFLEGIYIISHSSIKLNLSFPPRVCLVIPLLCHRDTTELLGNQTYVLSLLGIFPPIYPFPVHPILHGCGVLGLQLAQCP